MDRATSLFTSVRGIDFNLKIRVTKYKTVMSTPGYVKKFNSTYDKILFLIDKKVETYLNQLAVTCVYSKHGSLAVAAFIYLWVDTLPCI